jgi:hypothetical protein
MLIKEKSISTSLRSCLLSSLGPKLMTTSLNESFCPLSSGQKKRKIRNKIEIKM